MPLEILESDNKTITSRIKYKENQTIQKADERISLVISDSLLSATEKAIMKNDTIYRIAIKDEEYTAHLYVEDGNLTLESSKTYGNSGDVATASEYAKNMVIVKVNGDLTINSGVTLTAYGTQYGGPKGMLVYATGTLTNNGTISMTARGAKAVGQNVYLWKNQDATNAEYEYVPATGGTGGASITGTGNTGTAATNRQTGGGGSGGGYSKTSGAGAAGTSYSGGTGGGGSMYYRYVGGGNSTKTVNMQGGTGSINGASGGSGTYNDSMYYAGIGVTTGGAGNPGGQAGRTTASNGTGGLLIIYGNKIHNEGNIYADGSKAGSVVSNYTKYNRAGGGGSGGGSINIFYKTTCTKGTIIANGGIGGVASYNGGTGGSGSISIGNISTGTYVEYVEVNSTELFGQYVNYEIDLDGNGNTTDDWQIFYKEEDPSSPNYGATYITADYYVPVSKMATSLSNAGMTQYPDSTYRVYWNSAPIYQTITDTVKQIFMYDYPGGTDQTNVKCVATLLNTDNWKDEFVTAQLQEKGGLAIGSPTLNMWCASWNKIYPTEKVTATISGTGYQVNGSSTLWLSSYIGYKTDAPNVYFPTKSQDDDGTTTYWLASPASGSSDSLESITFNSCMYGDGVHSNNNLGVRPVVYLPSSVTLEPSGTTNVWNINYGE